MIFRDFEGGICSVVTVDGDKTSVHLTDIFSSPRDQFMTLNDAQLLVLHTSLTKALEYRLEQKERWT